MKRKVLSLLVFCTIFAAAFGVPAAADVTLGIISPADGSVVSELTEIKVYAGSGISELVLELDGIQVAVHEGGGEVTQPLDAAQVFAGRHTLAVYGVLADGSLKMETSEFTYIRSTQAVVFKTDFEEGMAYDGETKIVSALPDKMNYSAYGNSDARVAEGKEGAGDTALKISSNGGANEWSGPYLQIYTNAPYPNNIFVIESDIKLATNNDIFATEFKSSQGSSYFFVKQKYLFNPSGKVEDTDFSYSADTWMHTKMVMDYNNRTIALYIDGEHVITRECIGQDSNFYLLRMRVCSPRASVDAAFTIDNIKMYNTYTYSGINRMSAIFGGNEFTDNIPCRSEAIKLYMNEGINSSYVNGDNISLTVDGRKIKVDSFDYDSERNTITANISGELPENAVVEATISESLKLSDGKLTEIKAKGTLKTEKGDFSLNSVNFKAGGQEIVSKRQLTEGANLSCDFEFTNQTAEQKKALLVMTLKDGNKLLKISAKTIVIGIGTNEYSVAAEIPTAENLKVNAICYDKWGSLKALSDIYRIN